MQEQKDAIKKNPKNILEDRIQQGKSLASYRKAIINDPSIPDSTKDEVNRLYSTYCASFLAYYEDTRKNHPDLQKVLDAHKQQIEAEYESFDRALVTALTIDQVSADVTSCLATIQKMATTFQAQKTNEQERLNKARDNIRHHLGGYSLDIHALLNDPECNNEGIKEALKWTLDELNRNLAKKKDDPKAREAINKDIEKYSALLSKVDEKINALRGKKGDEYINISMLDQDTYDILERVLARKNSLYGALYAGKKDAGREEESRGLKEKADKFGAWHKIFTSKDLNLSESANTLFGAEGQKLVDGAAKLKNAKSYEEARQAMVGLIGEDLEGVKKGQSEFKLDEVYTRRILAILSQRSLYAFLQAIVQRTSSLEKPEGLEQLQEYVIGNIKRDFIAAAKTGNAAEINKLLQLNINIQEIINFQDDKGMSPLLYAAQNGHRDVFNLLRENGADINAHNLNGGTALNLASTPEIRNELQKEIIAKEITAAMSKKPNAEPSKEDFKAVHQLLSGAKEFMHAYQESRTKIEGRLPSSSHIARNPQKLQYLKNMIKSPHLHSVAFEMLQAISPSLKLDTKFITKFNKLFDKLQEMPNIQQFSNSYQSNEQFRQSIEQRLPQSSDIAGNPDKLTYLQNMVSNPSMHSVVFDMMQTISPSPKIDTKFITKFNQLFDELQQMPGIQQFSNSYQSNEQFRQSVIQMLPQSSDIVGNPDKLTYLQDMVSNPSMHQAIFGVLNKISGQKNPVIHTAYIQQFQQFHEQILAAGDAARQFAQAYAQNPQAILSRLPLSSDILANPEKMQYLKSMVTNPARHDIAFRMLPQPEIINEAFVVKFNQLFAELGKVKAANLGNYEIISSKPEYAGRIWLGLEEAGFKLNSEDKARATATILSNLPKNIDPKDFDKKLKEIMNKATEKKTFGTPRLHIDLLPAATQAAYNPKIQKAADILIAKCTSKLNSLEQTQALHTVVEVIKAAKKDQGKEDQQLGLDHVDKVNTYLTRQLSSAKLSKDMLITSIGQEYLANAISNPILAEALNSIIPQNEKRGMLTDIKSVDTFNLVFKIIENALPEEIRHDPVKVPIIVKALESTICENGKLTTKNIGLFENNAIKKIVDKAVINLKAHQEQKSQTPDKPLNKQQRYEQGQEAKNLEKARGLEKYRVTRHSSSDTQHHTER